MESIVSIQYCICLTSITGGVISIIWYLLGRLLEKAGFLNIVYTLLKVTTIFWIYILDTSGRIYFIDSG